MGGMFSKPKAVKPPPPAAPAAVPGEAPEAGETAIRRARRRRGFQKTMLTGGLSPTTGKKTTLG